MKKIVLIISLIPFILFAQKKDFVFVQKIVASDRCEDTVNIHKGGDWFGWDVAVNGKSIVVSARNKPLNNKKSVGEVYLFEQNKYGKWIEKRKFTSKNKESSDYFGSQIALNSNSLIISADGEGVYPNKYKELRGGVYFYNKIEGNWKLTNHILSDKYGRLGHNIALRDNKLAISDYINNNVFIFNKKAGNWNVVDTITKKTLFFSMGIAVSDKFAVTNVPNVKTNTNVFDIYHFDENGKAVFLQQISPPNKKYTFDNRVFLYKNFILLSSVVGYNNKGKVFLYELNKKGIWEFKKIFQSNLKIKGDFYGSDFCMNDKYIVIGAMGNDIDKQGNLKEIEGAVYIYKKTNNQWVFHQKLKAVNPNVWDKYGFSVDISDKYIVVGCRFDKEDENEENPINAAGAVYIYKTK